ncbi:RES family NAD+ phosphorylase [Citricoccus zhacaiensis]
MRTPDGRDVDPLVEPLTAGTALYRIHEDRFAADSYNPGATPARPTHRFSFFGSPTVPVLYASDSPEGAVSETLLQGVPITGGRIEARTVRNRILSTVVVQRPLRLLALHGHGSRKIGTEANSITHTPPSAYASTVPWTEAAHEAGLDGFCWMSRHHDTSRAVVLFGVPGAPGASTDVWGDASTARPFALPGHMDWLTLMLAGLGVDIVDP